MVSAEANDPSTPAQPLMPQFYQLQSLLVVTSKHTESHLSHLPLSLLLESEFPSLFPGWPCHGQLCPWPHEVSNNGLMAPDIGIPLEDRGATACHAGLGRSHKPNITLRWPSHPGPPSFLGCSLSFHLALSCSCPAGSLYTQNICGPPPATLPKAPTAPHTGSQLSGHRRAIHPLS